MGLSTAQMLEIIMSKSAKKVAKKSAATNGKHVETRAAVIRLLLRKNGATMRELIDAGHNQPAATALKLAETRGLKTHTSKEEGGLTHYFATGTPQAVTRKAPAKKATKKVAKKAKKAAKRSTRKPAEKVTEASATA